MKRLAHLSDLHLGKNEEVTHRTDRLAAALLREGVDHLAVTGDVTHRGRMSELALFSKIFAHWIDAEAISVVPGNHDRLGDNAGEALIDGRVHVDRRGELAIVRLDSTADHNRSIMMPHGEVDAFDVAAVARALLALPADALRVVILHHHPMPLPEDNVIDRIGGFLRITQGRSLIGGERLLQVLQGRCALVLHGHRHVPRWGRVMGEDTALDIYNAGSSTEMNAFRVFDYEGGRVRGARWASSELAQRPSLVTDQLWP